MYPQGIVLLSLRLFRMPGFACPISPQCTKFETCLPSLSVKNGGPNVTMTSEILRIRHHDQSRFDFTKCRLAKTIPSLAWPSGEAVWSIVHHTSYNDFFSSYFYKSYWL